MIIQKTIEVSLHSKNIKYFESLGYNIPKYHRYGHKHLFVPRGSKITVKVSDLQPNYSKKVLCKCDVCGKEKEVIFQQITRHNGEYICIKCSHTTDEFRKKCGWAKGTNLSKEHKRKLCDNNWQAKHRGNKSPFWNPNLTDEDRSKNHSVSGFNSWRTKVKKRDKYTCQKCGYVAIPNDGTICVHHINNFAEFKEQRTDVDNGITFCQNCHISFHKRFGAKTTKEHLKEFLE
jgi:hypothetical protein